MNPLVLLTVAGSDCAGGAGIQGDLKTFSALGAFGCSVVTAITAQDSLSVYSIQGVRPDIVKDQLEAVLRDLKPSAIKLGMVCSGHIIKVIASTLKLQPAIPIIIDPVILSSSGHPLLDLEAIHIMKEELFPLAQLITPNIPEAETITQMKITSNDDVYTACKAISIESNSAVLLKGGHREDNACDVLYDGKDFHRFAGEKILTQNSHGTGCALASAITVYLARGDSLIDSVRQAKTYVTGAILHSHNIGAGNGPINHFWNRVI